MRFPLFLFVLLASCLAPRFSVAQQQGAHDRFYSFVVEQPLSILQEKQLIQQAVDMDPYAKVLLDESRQALVVRTRSGLTTAAYTQAAGQFGVVLQRRLEETSEHQPDLEQGN